MSQQRGHTIREVRMDDAASIAELYNTYIEQTVITFEEMPVTSEIIAQRIGRLVESQLPWFVATDAAGRLQGYAYAAPWRERSAYRHSVEVSIYLDQSAQGKGIGSALYTRLFKCLSEAGKVHVALAGIALPNDASIALHEKFDMHKVAHLPEVGFKFGEWVDVAYWQRTF